MSSQGISLTIRPRGNPVKKLPEEVSLPPNSKGSQVYDAIASKAGISIYRLRVTKGSDGALVPNSKDLPLEKTGLLDQSTIYVKDLGPQVGWRTVYLVEYVGALLIHPLIYLLRPYIYASPSPTSFPAPSSLQTLSLALITGHFLKRELETLFVHRFSAATMPVRNIFKNSFYYWIVSGLNIAYWIYRPTATIASEDCNMVLTALGVFFYVAGELGNFNTHLALMNLRSSGGTERGIPKGWGFKLVTSPNYMFELAAWVGILMVTRSWSTLIFDALAFGQMAIWARQRETRYRREFGDKYKRKRYVILPGIY